MASLRLQGIRPRVLDPVDLTIAAGDLVFVSGPSGSGKSLLLRAVADLDPHDGEAWLDGVARSTLPAPQWRLRVGLLPAESHWWSDEVRSHFRLAVVDRSTWPPPLDDLPQAVQGCNDLLTRLGFEPDVLDWTVTRLSTGERQRLAFARLLHVSPQFLLLDEATANLDPLNRDRVETLVEGYRVDQAAGVLWVSHDPEQRRRLPGRRLTIQGGRLVPEESTP